MSTSPLSNSSSIAHQDGQQVPRFQGNHRRKPPEHDIAQLQHQQQQYGGMDVRELTHLNHEQCAEQPVVSSVSSVGDSSTGLDSPGGSHQGAYSGQYSVQIGGGAGLQPMPLDSSGGNGDSSSAEGRPLEGNSSGGSSLARLTRRSKAEDWFNTFNRDVRGNQSYPNYDNDSPYYIPNLHRKKYPQGSFRQPRSARSHHGGFPDRSTQGEFRGPVILDSTEESKSDSFRGVIDDLTIKNQKLKRRLRKLEGLHGHTTHAERLFEVRVHDLPECKKAELEKLLQSFTASIDAESLGKGSSQSSGIVSGNRSSAIDSGYASVSRSRNNSTPTSGNRDSDDSSKMWGSQTTIEVKKMKLVVRRLEQLFTGGKTAVVGARRVLHQQDISNLAAAEEQEAKILAGGQIDVEGTRESSLMCPPGSNNQFIDSDSKESLVTNEEPEQRPTRPLDLDPWREQVPEDNIEYLIHMIESSSKAPGMRGGWVYLNLISNLAQLHTINVTLPFIKKAIAAASSRLELSSDGKMVRWKGNDAPDFDGSMSGGARSEQSPGSGSTGRDGSGSESRSGTSDRRFGSGINVGNLLDLHKFHYRPLFARSQSFEDDSSSTFTSDTDSQGQKRSSSDESRGAGSKSDTGPIIFYKGGGFCTDLSSQPLREDEELTEESPTRYVRATTRPLGSTLRHLPPPSTKDESPLYRAAMVIPEGDVMEIDRDDDQNIIDFSPQFPATSEVTSPPVPIEFEASGIGGVLPADNFAINCETKYYLLPDNHGRLPVSKSKALKSKSHKKILPQIPKASINAFHDEDNMTDSSVASTESKVSKSPRLIHRRPLRHELLSANTLKLPPSSLPPASYIFTSASDDSSSYGETDDDAPRSSGSEGYFFHQTSLNTYRTPSSIENEIIASPFERSPSSAATAGDRSRAPSLFSERSNTEDQTYEGPLSMDSEQSSSVESGDGLMPPVGSRMKQQSDAFNIDRPSLKRSRGSVISSHSNQQVRKSLRVQSSNLPSSSDDS